MSSASKGSELAECRPAARTNQITRAFDFICAAVGLVVLSPLFVVVAIAVKFDDRGPVLYTQDRVGRAFKTFRLHKFRSMVAGADRHGLLTSSGDSRLTRVGRLLRRSKVDELPQLLNVLRGDMQLVGARPEVDKYVQMFRQQYAELLEDRPGITDPASLAYRHEEQILSAGRVENQYVEEILPAKLELSLDYQRRRTFFSDVGLLFKTLLSLFK